MRNENEFSRMTTHKVDDVDVVGQQPHKKLL